MLSPLESGKMKSKSLINILLGEKNAACLDLFEISLIIVYMNMRLSISQISNYQDSGYIHGVGSTTWVDASGSGEIVPNLIILLCSIYFMV